MKLVIIPIDGAVYVDGFSYSDLDLSFCPSDVHAVQWNVSKGWIEFKENDEGIKHANQVILELPAWALKAKGKWDEEAARLAAEEAARLAAEEAAKQE
jgi:hypothetical protein